MGPPNHVPILRGYTSLREAIRRASVEWGEKAAARVLGLLIVGELTAWAHYASGLLERIEPEFWRLLQQSERDTLLREEKYHVGGERPITWRPVFISEDLEKKSPWREMKAERAGAPHKIRDARKAKTASLSVADDSREDARLSSYAPLKREDIHKLHSLGKLSRGQLATWDRIRGKTRNRILSRVRQGRLSPKQAEGWTKKRGEDSFETPRTSLYDPMSLANWTLAMVTAWIIWRTPDAVRESWSDFRCECRGWEHIAISENGLERVGWELRRLPPISRSCVRELAMRQDDPANHVESPIRACDQLDRNLQSGELETSGIPHGGRRRVKIPAHDWIDFSYLHDDDQRPESIFSEEGGEPRYDVVRVRVGDVLRVWKPLPDVATPSVADETPNYEAIQPADVPPAAISPVDDDAGRETETVGGAAERRAKIGLRPVGKPRIIGDIILSQMRKMDPTELRNMSEKQMKHFFKAERSTCRSYRRQVMAENGDN